MHACLPINALEIQLLQQAYLGLASGEGVRIASIGGPSNMAQKKRKEKTKKKW
jgi:hypothetical protein